MAMLRPLALALLLGLEPCGSTPTGAGADPPAVSPVPAPVEAATPAEPKPDPAALAQRIAEESIIVDGHIDVPWRLHKGRKPDGALGEDVLRATARGDFDLPRARAGGLDAPFMSIFVSSEFEKKGAKKVADDLIDMMEQIAASAPTEVAIARTTAEVRANAGAGKLSFLLGMENGAPIAGKLANLSHFHARGIRYITLTHSKDNHISDSSFDTRHTHKGLSKFGKQVVPEMNRLGIVIDVSHLSDDAFWQVLDLSKAPVFASHSSCRHFTPGWERNMSDEMIRALADKDGVILINFGSDFLDSRIREARDAHEAAVQALLQRKGTTAGTQEAEEIVRTYEAEHPAPRAKVEQVADHIDHVIALVGVDHVGLGSDFDGVGDSLPDGLRDVSQYPNLVRVLLERGHARADIEKILGGNALRVLQAVEDHAREQG
jgi:membrane dipeptidase